MQHLFKKRGVQIEIGHAVKRCVRVGYIVAITKKCTTSEATELGVLRMSQLVLLVGQKTGVFNLTDLLVNVNKLL